MHRSSFFYALIVLRLAVGAYAHGFVTSVVIDGKTYPGSNGADASSGSPVRKVSTGSPVTNVESKEIICGVDAQPASGVASAKPGSTLKFFWKGQTGINWFHSFGPIQTFMAKCPDSCTSFTPSASTAWFKIYEAGQRTPGSPNSWVQAELLTGAPATVTLPSNLAPGDYLVRHEVIALHNAVSEGGAEPFPSCLQVSVSGSSKGTPDKTVHFPGAYSPTDPGLFGNFYNPGTPYEFPGGPIAKLGNNGGSDATPPTTSRKPSLSASSTSAPQTNTVVSSFSPSAAQPSPSPASPSKGRCRTKRKRRSAASEVVDSFSSSKRRAINLHHKRSRAAFMH